MHGRPCVQSVSAAAKLSTGENKVGRSAGDTNEVYARVVYFGLGRSCHRRFYECCMACICKTSRLRDRTPQSAAKMQPDMHLNLNPLSVVTVVSRGRKTYSLAPDSTTRWWHCCRPIASAMKHSTISLRQLQCLCHCALPRCLFLVRSTLAIAAVDGRLSTVRAHHALLDSRECAKALIELA